MRRRGMSAAGRRMVGLSATALAVIVMVLVFHPPSVPWGRPLHMHLRASSFGELNRQAAVYLGGVRAGTVEAIRWERGQPVLDVAIEPEYRDRVHRDASATIRPHGLLGPQYVDLDGGRTGAMPEGGTIPQSRVRVAVQMDEVLNSLRPDVRESLKTLLVEMSRGSEDRGPDVNRAILDLGRSHGDLQVTADTIQARDRDLAGFLVFSEQLNRDLQNAPIDRQIADTDRVLAALVAVEDSLGQGIDETAGTLRGLDVVMNGNDQNLAYILKNLSPNMLRLRTAVAAGDRLVVGLNPSLPALMTAALETKSAFSYSDANGHYVKVMSVSGPCTAGLSGDCGTPSGRPGTSSTSGAPVPAGGQKSDQELIQALLGGRGG